MQPKISLITLGVSDLEQSIRFYEQGLGWKAAQRQENVVFYQLNNLVISLYPKHLLAEDANQTQIASSGFNGITLAYNTESEQEVDQIIQDLEQFGATIVKRPQKVFWGGYSSYFTDPDGYLWEVAYNPFFPFDDQGNLALT